jgi:hypothetical protein
LGKFNSTNNNSKFAMMKSRLAKYIIAVLFCAALLASQSDAQGEGEVTFQEETTPETFAQLDGIVPESSQPTTFEDPNFVEEAPDWPTAGEAPKTPSLSEQELLEAQQFQCAPGGERAGMCSHFVRKGMQPQLERTPLNEAPAEDKITEQKVVSALSDRDNAQFTQIGLAPEGTPDNIPDYGKEPPIDYKRYSIDLPALEKMHTTPNRFVPIPSPEEQGGAETEILVEYESNRLDVPKMPRQAAEKAYLRAGEHSMEMRPLAADEETQAYQRSKPYKPTITPDKMTATLNIKVEPHSEEDLKAQMIQAPTVSNSLVHEHLDLEALEDAQPVALEEEDFSVSFTPTADECKALVKKSKALYRVTFKIADGGLPTALPPALTEAVSKVLPVTNFEITKGGITFLVDAPEVPAAAAKLKDVAAKAKFYVDQVNDFAQGKLGEVNARIQKGIDAANAKVAGAVNAAQSHVDKAAGDANAAVSSASKGLIDPNIQLDITGLAKVLSLDPKIVTDMVDKLGGSMKGAADMAKDHLDSLVAKFDDATKGISMTAKLPMGGQKIPVTISATQIESGDESICDCASDNPRLGLNIEAKLRIKGKSSVLTSEGEVTVSARYSNRDAWDATGDFTGKAGIMVDGAGLELDTMSLGIEKCNGPATLSFKSSGRFLIPLLKEPIKINSLDGEYIVGDGWGITASLSGTPLGVKVNADVTLAKKEQSPLVLIAKLGFPDGVDLKKFPLIKDLPGADMLPLVGEGALFEQTFFPSADPFFEAFNVMKKVGKLNLNTLKTGFKLPKNLGSLSDLGALAELALKKKLGNLELNTIAMLGKLGTLGDFSNAPAFALKLKKFNLGKLGTPGNMGSLADLLASGKFPSPSTELLEQLTDLAQRVRLKAIDLKSIGSFKLGSGSRSCTIGSLGDLGKLILTGKLKVGEISKFMQLSTLGDLGVAKLKKALGSFNIGQLGPLSGLGKLASIASAGKLGLPEITKLGDLGQMGILGKVCASIPIPELPDTVGVTLSGKDLCTLPAVTIDPPIKATIQAKALEPITGSSSNDVEGSVSGTIDITGKNFDLDFGVKITPQFEGDAGSDKKFIQLLGASTTLGVKYNKEDGLAADFVAKGKIGIRDANPIDITLSGNYAKDKKMCIQAFGEGQAFKTKANVLLQACREPAGGTTAELVQGTTKPKTNYLGTICTPEGVTLGNLPGLKDIPMIDKVPTLGEGACVNLGNIVGKLSQLTGSIKDKLSSLSIKDVIAKIGSVKLPNLSLTKPGSPLGNFKLGNLGSLSGLGDLGGFAIAGKIGMPEINSLVKLFELGKLGKLNSLQLANFQIGRIGTVGDFGSLGQLAIGGKIGFPEINFLKQLANMGDISTSLKKFKFPSFKAPSFSSKGPKFNFPKISISDLADFAVGALGKISEFGKLAEIVLDGKWLQSMVDEISALAMQGLEGKLKSLANVKIGGFGCSDLGELCELIKNNKIGAIEIGAFSKLTQLGAFAEFTKYIGGAKQIASFLATIDQFAEGFCVPKITVTPPKEGMLEPLRKFMTADTSLSMEGCLNLKAKEFEFTVDLTGGLSVKAGNFLSVEGKAAKASIARKGAKNYVKFSGSATIKLPTLTSNGINIELGGSFATGGAMMLYGKASTTLFKAPVSMSFKLERKKAGGAYDVMVVVSVPKMGIQDLPGLKSVNAVKNLNLENAFVIASNYDSTWEGVAFKAGLTMHGEVVLTSAGQSNVDSFLKPLKNFFQVSFQKMSLSAWIAAKSVNGKRDFSILAGIKGSVTFIVKIAGIEFARMGMTNPSAEVWQTQGKTTTKFDFGGSFKLKNIFDMSFKDSPLKLVPGGFVFDIKLPLWGQKVPVFISYGQKLTLEQINAVPPTKLGDIATKLGAGKVVQFFKKGGFQEMELEQIPETMQERDTMVLLQDTMVSSARATESTPIYFQIGPIADVSKITDLMTGGFLSKFLKIGPKCTITLSNYKRNLAPELKKLVGAGSVKEGITIFTSVGPAPGSLFDKLRILVKMPAAAKGCFAIGSWGISADMYFPELKDRPQLIADLGLVGKVSMTLLKFMAEIRFKPKKGEERFKLAMHGKLLMTKTPIGNVAMPDVYVDISDKRVAVVSQLGSQILLKNPDVRVNGVTIALVKDLPGTFMGGFQLSIPSATVPNLLIHALKSIPIKLDLLVDLLKKFAKLLVTPFEFKLSKIEKPMSIDVKGMLVKFIEDGFSLDVGAFFLEMIKVVVPSFGLKFPNLGCVLRFTFPVKALINTGGGTNPSIQFKIENLPTILGRFKIVTFGFQAELQLVPYPKVILGVQGHVKLLLNTWLGLAMDASISADGEMSLGLSMPGMWKQAFGLPFLDIGNLWFRINLSPLAAACPGPCGIKALGMGGEIRFGSTKAAANGYIDFLEPQKMFVNFRGENMGVGTIAGVFKCPATVQKVANTLFPTFNKLAFTYATMSGAIGPAGAPYPQRINFFAGMQFEADATFIGLHAHAYVAVMLPPQYTLPDFQISFGLKVPDLIGKFVGIVRDYIPFGESMFQAMKKVLSVFGINFQLPIFKVDELALEKFSVVKFVTNQAPFWIKAAFTIFGTSYKGELKFFFKDAIALFKNFPQFAKQTAVNIIRELGEKIVQWFSNFRLSFCGLTLTTQIPDKTYLKVRAEQEGSFIAKLATYLVETMKGIANDILGAFGLGRPFLAEESMMLVGHTFDHIPAEAFSAKSMLLSMQPKETDKSYAVALEIHSLIRLIPTDLDKSCRVAKKIVRSVGLRKFQRLTGLRRLNCNDPTATMACTKAQYETMATRLEARTAKKYTQDNPKMVAHMQSKAREAIKRQGLAHLDLVQSHKTQVQKELKNHISTLEKHRVAMIQETTQAHAKLHRKFSQSIQKDVAMIEKVAPTAMLAYQKCVDAAMAVILNKKKERAGTLMLHRAKHCAQLEQSALPLEAIQVASQAAKMAAVRSKSTRKNQPVKAETKKGRRALLQARTQAKHSRSEDLAAGQTAAKKAKLASEPAFVQEGAETTDFSMDKAKMKAKAGWHRWRPHGHWPHRYNPIAEAERAAKHVERGAKHVERGAKAVAERAAKAAERTAKAAERTAKEAARRVERAAKQATNWVKNKIAEMGRALTNAANAAVNAINRVIQKAKDAANSVWNAAKARLEQVYNAAKSAMNNAIKWVFDLVKKLLSYLPKFRYVEFGNIYIRCMIDPKGCNIRNAKLPTFKICFSKIGCLSTGEMPTVSGLGAWFKSHVLDKIKAWFQNLIVWKNFRFDIPNCSGGCFTWGYQNFYYPKPYLKYKNWYVFGKTVSAPYGLGVTNTLFARVNIPNGIKTQNVGLTYPGGLNLSGAESEAKKGAAEAAANERSTKSKAAAAKAATEKQIKADKAKEEKFVKTQEKDQKGAAKTSQEAKAKGIAAKERAEKSKESMGKALKQKHTIPKP